jgi:hypothetical protein
MGMGNTKELTDAQVRLLGDIRDGRLTFVSINGAGTLSVHGYHWKTFDGLLARGLVTMRQDVEVFWKYHVAVVEP